MDAPGKSGRATSRFSVGLLVTSSILLLAILAFVNGSVAAVGPNFTSETLITGLNEPTSVNFLPDGRMLILSRYGSFNRYKQARHPSIRLRFSLSRTSTPIRANAA